MIESSSIVIVKSRSPVRGNPLIEYELIKAMQPLWGRPVDILQITEYLSIMMGNVLRIASLRFAKFAMTGFALIACPIPTFLSWLN